MCLWMCVRVRACVCVCVWCGASLTSGILPPCREEKVLDLVDLLRLQVEEPRGVYSVSPGGDEGACGWEQCEGEEGARKACARACDG
jgi:hypothetical protein